MPISGASDSNTCTYNRLVGGISSDRDALTVARISGHVSYLLHHRWPHARAVESLRELSADRADLLAEWAGILLGANKPDGGEWPEVTAQVKLLMDAGAQVDAVPGWASIGRDRQGSWADQHWPPIPDLSEALGAPVAQIRHDTPGDGLRDGWWHLVIHPLPHFSYGQDPYLDLARAFGRVLPPGLDHANRRNIHDTHRIVFGLRCRDAVQRLQALRENVTPLLPPGATTTLT